MKIKKNNWYGLNHERVNKMLSGDLTYLNDLCVNGEYLPVSVYKAANPDKKKGHKKYVLIGLAELSYKKGYFVRGMSPKEMSKYRYQKAIHCSSCDETIYSVMRHHNKSCKCGSVSVDGGKDYFKYSYDKKSKFKAVRIDILTGKVIGQLKKL